jgi:hypothetical protein
MRVWWNGVRFKIHFTLPYVVSLLGHLTVVHVQGRVHACALLSYVVNSCSKGTNESQGDSVISSCLL